MAIDKLAEAVSELAKSFQMWVSGADKRRLRNAVDIADRIIKRYRLLTPHQDAQISRWSDKFYDYIA